MMDVRNLRPVDFAVGAIAGAIAVASQLADPEVISAVATVVWRAEGLFDLPEWVSWLVFVVLIVVALATIRQAAEW